MQMGKLPEAAEKRTVFRNIGRSAGEKEPACTVLAGQAPDAFGMAGDTAALEYDCRIGYLIDRVQGLLAAEDITEAVYSAALIVPEKLEEPEIRQLVKRIADECGRREIKAPALQVKTGRNTEAELFLAGSGRRRGLVTKPGRAIIMVGQAAKEATALMIQKNREELKRRLSGQYLDMALAAAGQTDMREAISIARGEAALVKLAGEGGIFAALWQLGEYLGSGMEITLRKILLCQETIEVCEILDRNPYFMFSTGCFLAVTDVPVPLLKRYAAAGIPAAQIGMLCDGNDRVVYNEEEKRFLEPFRGDDWYR